MRVLQTARGLIMGSLYSPRPEALYHSVQYRDFPDGKVQGPTRMSYDAGRESQRRPFASGSYALSKAAFALGHFEP